MKKELAPKKVDSIAGKLAAKQVFPITYNVDRMYYELYCAVLRRNNVSFSELPVVLINDGRTEQHTVVVDREDMKAYMERTTGCFRKDGDNQWYLKLFHVPEIWEEIKKEWAENPSKWRDVWS